MEVFETVLTGTDGPIDGLVSSETLANPATQYTFSSLDGTLNLTITKDDDGYWRRISSTEPYLSGWTEQLGELIDQRIPSTTTF